MAQNRLVLLLALVLTSAACGGGVEQTQPQYPQQQPGYAQGGYGQPGPGQAPPGAYGQDPNQRVTISTWCTSLGSSYCRNCMSANSSQCMNAFVPSCISNRDPNQLTDRTVGETQVCGQALESTECSSMSGGNLPMVCRSRSQQAQAQYGQGAVGVGGGDENVTVQTWCGELAQNYCRHCQPSGVGECINTFVPSCLSGRDPSTVTNRTRSEVRACGVALEQADCQAIVSGSLPYACQPRR